MDFFQHILPTIEHFRLLGYWIVFIVSFIESIAFFGYLFPGTIITILVGFSAAKGFFDIKSLIWFAAAGAFLADVVSYWWGRKGTAMFAPKNRIFKVHYLEKGQSYFKKHGDKSVLLGRFIGPLRPIIPFIAGVCGMEKKKFYIIDLIGSLLWAIGYLFLGYFFGEAWKAIEIWSTRLGLAVSVILLLFVFLYAVRWLLIKKGRKIIYFSKSVGRSIKEAVLGNEEVNNLIRNHPDFFNFLRRRFDKGNFFGRPLTFFSLLFLYSLFLFIGVIKDVVTFNPLVEIDYRIANLMYAFRSGRLVEIFLKITLLGKFQIVLFFMIVATIIFWLWRKRGYILPMWVSVLGSELLAFLAKFIIQRPRPADLIPVYIEKSYSFPSAHATIAVAFYGFLTIFLWKNSRNWKSKINYFFWGITIIFLIGLSRVYLGVHYFGDVMGGYLLGLLWLIIAFSIIEWQLIKQEKTLFIPFVSKSAKYATAILLAAALLFFTLYAFTFQPPMNISRGEEKIIENISNPMDAFNVFKLSRNSETLSGQLMSPLSFIITAPDKDTLIKAFADEGWYLSDPQSMRSIYKIAKAEIFNESYLMAPITPSFWNREVNDLGFQKPTETRSVRQRHHARFWQTDFKTTDGKIIFVGTASLDIGMKWLVSHRIDPNIDSEREYIMQDLLRSKLVSDYKKLNFVKPVLGKNFAGDQFFTDGDAYTVELKK